MPVIGWSEMPEEAVEPGFDEARGRFVRGRSIEVGSVSYPAGSRIAPHAAVGERILVVMEGSARFRIGEAERLVGPGEGLLVRSGTLFGAEILDGGLQVYRFASRGEGAAGTGGSAEGPFFFRWEEMTSDFITPRYSSGQGPTITGERIEVAYMTYPAGTEGKPHVHPNEQIQVPLQGRACYLLEEPREAGPGEVVLIQPDLRHGAKIIEDFTVLNGKNIVPGWNVYEARWEK